MNDRQRKDSPASEMSFEQSYFQPVEPEHVQFLTTLQLVLESYYDIDPPYCISEFVCHSAQTETGSAQCKGTVPEMLVFREDSTNLDISLFLNASLLEGIDNHNYKNHWYSRNFENGCILLEGVSHFLYMVFNAHHDRQVSMLDLEVQAEIDKFIFSALHIDNTCSVDSLLQRLFCNISYREEMSSELRYRYERANELGYAYCQWLADNFELRANNKSLLAEISKIYRLNGSTKQAHILSMAIDQRLAG